MSALQKDVIVTVDVTLKLAMKPLNIWSEAERALLRSVSAKQ